MSNKQTMNSFIKQLEEFKQKYGIHLTFMRDNRLATPDEIVAYLKDQVEDFKLDKVIPYFKHNGLMEMIKTNKEHKENPND